MRRLLKAFALTVLAFVATGGASALTLAGVDWPGLEVESSVLLVRNAVGSSAVDPVVNTLGASLPLSFGDHWTFRPEVQAFSVDYAYRDGRAVPEGSAWDSVGMLTVALSPWWGLEGTWTPTLAWTAEAGASVFLRAPWQFHGTGASEMALPVTGWLLAGRFLYPCVGAGLRWQFSPLFALSVRGQAYLPVFNLWGGTPWDDQLTGGLNLGLRFSF